MKLLIVEDDELLMAGLKQALTGQGYVCDGAALAREADGLLRSGLYSAVLLDLGLPDRDGLSLLRDWRQAQLPVPVLILTARDALEDRVAGLDAGADDYLIKPFELAELLARVRALIRRQQGRSDNLIEVGNLALDLAVRSITIDGQLLALTPREFAVLSRLMLKAGKPVSRETLQQDLYTWKDDLSSNTLDVYIHHLRGKLGKARIQTLRGLGYMLSVEEAT